MKRAYLGLGSNLGDREANLRRAVESLRRSGVRVEHQSSLYETEPVELREQRWFLNCAVAVQTDLMPRQLLHAVLRIETQAGRRRLARSGPRVLDIDILLYGNCAIRCEELEVPHPRLAERRFALVPLCELAPQLHQPALEKTACQLLAETLDSSRVRLWRRA